MRKAATMDKNPDAEPTRVVRLTDPNCSSVFSAVGSCFSGMPFWYPALSGWQPCADPGHPCKCQPTSYAFWVVHEFAHNLFSGIGRLGEYVGCFDRADRCSLNPQGSFPDSFLHDKAAAVSVERKNGGRRRVRFKSRASLPLNRENPFIRKGMWGIFNSQAFFWPALISLSRLRKLK